MDFKLDADINIERSLDGTICIGNEFDCECSLGETLNGEYGVFYTIHDTDTPIYDGAYDVIPMAYVSQILPTQGKVMRGNVTVHEIPFYQTSNPSGGYTTIIGD